MDNDGIDLNLCDELAEEESWDHARFTAIIAAYEAFAESLRVNLGTMSRLYIQDNADTIMERLDQVLNEAGIPCDDKDAAAIINETIQENKI